MPFYRSDLIRTKDIYSFMPAILCSPSHRLSKTKSVHLKDLNNEKIAIPIDIGTFYPKLISALAKTETTVAFKQTGYSLESHQKFIESGGLIFIKPDPRLEVLYPDMKTIMVADKSLESKISLMTKDSSSPKAKILTSFASSLSDEIAKRKQLKVESH